MTKSARALSGVRLCIFTIVGYQLVLYLFTEFADWPETVLFPWMISKGRLPYRDFFDIHNPALYYLNGLLFRWFRVHLEFLRWEMALVMIGNTLGVFYVAKQAFDPWRGVVAAVTFVLLELPLFGNGIWFEQFVLPFLLIAARYLLRSSQQELSNQECLCLGLAFGAGALFKQTIVWVFFGALALIVFWSIMVLTQPLRRVFTKVLLLGIAALTPLLIHLIVLGLLGAAEAYLYSTVYLPLFDYSYPRAPGSTFVVRFLLWSMLACGFLYLHWRKAPKSKGAFNALLIFVFFIGALLFDYPTHGRVHLIPAVAFLAVVAADLSFQCNKQNLWIAIFLIPFFIWTIVDHVKAVSSRYGAQYKFSSSQPDASAAWINRNTTPDQRIYATGDLLFYVRADRLPATTNVYLYWWLLHGHYGADSIVRELEQRKPRFVVMDKDEIANPPNTPVQTMPIYSYIFSNYRVSLETKDNRVVLERKP